MKEGDQTNVIEKLIETCKDGEQGYKDAAQHVQDQTTQNSIPEV